ncbi:uncharacterized protein LOC120925114 [Rana temporaria]|uniref:uncharacterized protein LOC120925114 n=1 Tax=Rana temporaria TaxID=8407 RepID=UPI001AACF1CB|nr:uncharacterized protein LOC120925114 [Rana temporaria]
MERGALAGFIGDLNSDTTLQMAQLLNLYGYTQISYGARDTLLSDRKMYPNFFRTVPDDEMQYVAIAKLLERLKWNWVGILTSDDEYGEREIRHLSKHLSDHGICIEFKILVSKENCDKIPPELRSSTTEVLIICGSASMTYYKFLYHNVPYHMEKTFIIPDSWSMTEIFFALSNCSLAFTFPNLYIKEMLEYFYNIYPSSRPNDPLMEDILISELQCFSKNQMKNVLIPLTTGRPLRDCSLGKLSLDLYFPDEKTSYRVYISVYILAQALHDMDFLFKINNKQPEINPHTLKYKVRASNESLLESFYTRSVQYWNTMGLSRYVKEVQYKDQNGAVMIFNDKRELPSPMDIVNWITRIKDRNITDWMIVGHFDGFLSEGQQLTLDPEQISWKGDKQLISRLQKAGFCSCLLSDHAPYWVTLTPFTSSSTPNWRLNPFWLSILPDTDKLNTDNNFNCGTAIPLAVWKAFKKYARLLLTEHISRYKQSSKSSYVQAVAQVTSLEVLYETLPSADDLTRLKIRVVYQMCYEWSRHNIFFNKQRIFKHGPHPGKSIAHLAHIDSRPPVVIALRSPPHGFITDPEMITRESYSSILSQVPRGQCSEECLPGFRKSVREGYHPCCYNCAPCSEGEISNQSDSELCKKCPENEWPNKAKTICSDKVNEYLSYEEDILVLFFSITSVIFATTSILILGLFVWFRSTPIVRANNRNLSFILLLSLILSFLSVFLFLGRPVDITCMLQQVTFGVPFTISASSILAKTIMVFIAFKATRPGSSCRKWVGVKLPNTVMLFCSSIQVMNCILWLSISPPFQEYDMDSYPGKIIIQCNEGSVIGFYSMLGYMGFLAAVSFLLAFMVRTLPDSFNEAKYITFSMLVFCSVWIAMIPAYLSTRGKYMVAVEIFAILTSSAGILLCMFSPKLYILLFKPELNTRGTMLGKRMMEM